MALEATEITADTKPGFMPDGELKDGFSILPFDEKTQPYCTHIINQNCTVTNSGKVRSGKANQIRFAQANFYIKHCAMFDTATKKMVGSPFYEDMNELKLKMIEYFAKFGEINLTSINATEILERVAYENKYNSILSVLNNFKLPEKNPLPDLLSYFTFKDCAPAIAHEIFDLFFKKLAIKLLSLEVKWLNYVNDVVLIFEGQQGIGKTLTCKYLGLDGYSFYHDLGDTPKGDLTNKDVKLQIRGKIIVELGELSGLRKAEQEGVKAFISQAYDEYRPPYGHDTVNIPRTASCIGTTNESEYLSDPTGNRRWFPLSISNVNFALFQEQELIEGLYAYYLNWGQEILTGSRREIQKKLFAINLFSPELIEYLEQIRSDKRVQSRYETFLDDYIDNVNNADYLKLGRNGEAYSFRYFQSGEAARLIFGNAANIPFDFSKAFASRMRDEKLTNKTGRIDGKLYKYWV